MKKILVLFALLPILFGCNSYGEKVVYDGTEIYYKDGATKEDADKLGAYLQESEFTDGTTKSVMLVKNEAGNYVFRMVVQESYREGNDFMFQLTAMGISMGAFDNKPVDMDICDELFNTIRTIPFVLDENILEDASGTEEFSIEEPDSLSSEE